MIFAGKMNGQNIQSHYVVPSPPDRMMIFYDKNRNNNDGYNHNNNSTATASIRRL